MFVHITVSVLVIDACINYFCNSLYVDVINQSSNSVV